MATSVEVRVATPCEKCREHEVLATMALQHGGSTTMLCSSFAEDWAGLVTDWEAASQGGLVHAMIVPTPRR